MSFGALLRVALRALAANKLRSALTMLGIVIGAAAVIVMTAVGAGAQERVAEQIQSLGSNLLLLVSGGATASGARTGLGSTLTISEEDAEAIAREIPGTTTAAVLRGGVQAVWGNQNWATTVFGTTQDYLAIREWKLASGRFYDAADQAAAAKVCLIGGTVARRLFGDADPIGESIRIRRVPFTVIGLLESKGQTLLGTDQDCSVQPGCWRTATKLMNLSWLMR